MPPPGPEDTTLSADGAHTSAFQKTRALLDALLYEHPALADLIEALAELPEDKRRAILDALRGRGKR